MGPISKSPILFNMFIYSLFIHLFISLFCAVEYSLIRPRNRGNECSSLFKDITLTL